MELLGNYLETLRKDEKEIWRFRDLVKKTKIFVVKKLSVLVSSWQNKT
jgi:hypothetical protein